MKKIWLLFLLAPILVVAHQPWLIEYEDYHDTQVIEEPYISKAFYANLTTFPHNYEFTLEEKQEVFIEILVPDLPEIENNRSGLLVQRKDKGVELISRMEAREANWESFFEIHGGDRYRRGPSFRGDLEPGDYLFEVSAGANMGKYVLVVGEFEDFSDLGTLELYSRIYQVKRFFGKSPLAVFQSPYYCTPALLLVLVYLGYRFYRRKYA